MKKTLLALSLAVFALPVTAHSGHDHKQPENGLTVDVELLDPVKGNQQIGHVYVTESKYGLVFTPELKVSTAAFASAT